MTAPGGLVPVRVWMCMGLLAGMALRPVVLCAAEPAKTVEPADEDLIEFLGSVDSDDEGWKQYLARAGTKAPEAKKPPPDPPPSSAPEKDDAKNEN